MATVTTLDDTVDFTDGVTSLREAVFAANTLSGADTIEFDPALTTGGPATILLTMGELAISDSLTINGPGADLLTIDASGNDPTPGSTLDDDDTTNDGDGSRVFNISDGNVTLYAEVTIAGVTLTGGDPGVGAASSVEASGGAVLSIGVHFTLAQSIIRENMSIRFGGGVYFVDGMLTLVGCEITGNRSDRDGGGVRVGSSTVEIQSSLLTDNVASLSAGGLCAESCEVAISDSHIDGNQALGGSAGGIHAKNTRLEISASTVDDNYASASGGGIEVLGNSSFIFVNSSASRNRADGGILSLRGGGGIFVSVYRTTTNDADLIIRGSRITENSAANDGGGLFLVNSHSDYHFISSVGRTRELIEETEILGNSAGRDGGGIFAAHTDVVIRDSSIADNDSQQGGGVFGTLYATVQLLQSLIRDNSAAFDGGGIAMAVASFANPSQLGGHLYLHDSAIERNNAGRDGGGVYLTNGVHSLINSTVAWNEAEGQGGGVVSRVPTLSYARTEIFQVTMSGNRAGGSGGGLVGGAGTKVYRSTIAGNTSDSDGDGSGMGGGVMAGIGLVIDHSIVADNRCIDQAEDWVGEASLQANYSVIENVAGAHPVTGVGNILGQDPRLGPLSYHGGPTFLDGSGLLTHTLLAGSPAVDAGDPMGGASLLWGAYWAEVVSDQPWRYYRFEEMDSLLAIDEMSSNLEFKGSYIDGISLGQPGIVDGTRAFGLNGTSSYVSFSRIPIRDSFTAEIWIRSASETWNASGWILNVYTANGFVINPIQGSTAWSATLFDSQRAAHIVGTFTPDVSVDIRDWHHYALSWDQDTGLAKMYFDGVEVASQELLVSRTLLSSSANWKVGYSDAPGLGSSRFGQGDVDEMAIYGRSLSSGEVLEHFQIRSLANYDERESPWSRVVNGDDAPEARIDMGAVEWQANPLAGDYNFNGAVDAADFTVWRDTLGSTNDLRADGSGAMVGVPDGVVDEYDFVSWKASFGNVLELGDVGAAALAEPVAPGVGSGASAASAADSTGVWVHQPPADPEAGCPAGVGEVAVTRSLPFEMTHTPIKPPADPEAGYPAGAAGRVRVAVPRRDDALLAWLARRDRADAGDNFDVPSADAGADAVGEIFDEVFAGLGGGW